MTQYDNRNSGALFQNDRKTKSSQPDYRGSMTDSSGKEFWISAWVKSGRNGDFLSLAFEEKQDMPVNGARTLGAKPAPTPRTPAPTPRTPVTPPPRNEVELDDDLPF